MFIYEQANWPHVTWRKELLLQPLAKVAFLQGKILGQIKNLGFDLQQEAIWHVVTQNIITSSTIEGEHLEYEQVRSSVSRHLAIPYTHPFPNDHHVDCMVEMMFDALDNCQEPLTLDRLYRWHGALFFTGFSGMHRINVGSIRNDEKGPMHVVSRSAEPSEVVHFQAPVSSTLPRQLTDFLEWINEPSKEHPFIKTAVAHLWVIVR